MTFSELSVSMHEVHRMLEDAQTLMSELTEGYFTLDDKAEILGKFKQGRAFARALSCCLSQIESEVPTPEWIQSLKEDLYED